MRILLALTLPLFLVGCPSEKSPSATPEPQEDSQPSTPKTEASRKPLVQISYEGVWATKDDQGEAFDMVIFPNGQAVTNWPKGVEGAKGERGYWRIENNRLLAVYEDGWTDALEPAVGGFQHKGFSPQTQLGGNPTNSAAATKIEGPNAAYIGVWRMNREPDGSYQYVALQSNGRALSTVNGGTEGKWELTEKGARCTWPADGWVDLIESSAQGWQKRSWVGSESETPADVSPVLRVGETKFLTTP